MNNNQFTNVRFESKNYNQMTKEIKHDLRTIKQKTRINNNENSFLRKNNNEWKIKKYKEKDESVIIESKDFIKSLKDIEDKHRKLLRKNQNQSLNKNRVNSFNIGVLTFSDSMTELVKDENKKQQIIKDGFQTIINICKELNIDLHYAVFHNDEKGIPHFHFFTNNFNNDNGKSINVRLNKDLGSKLQDLGNKNFEKYGFKRGIKKEFTGKKHLTIKEYQEYQDAKKEIKQIKEENIELITVNNELKDNNNKLNEENIELNEENIELKTINNKYEDINEKINSKIKILKENISNINRTKTKNNMRERLDSVMKIFKDNNEIDNENIIEELIELQKELETYLENQRNRKKRNTKINK